MRKRFLPAITAVLVLALFTSSPLSANAATYTYFQGQKPADTWTGTNGTTFRSYKASNQVQPNDGVGAWIYVAGVGQGSSNAYVEMSYSGRVANSSCKWNYAVPGMGAAYMTCKLIG